MRASDLLGARVRDAAGGRVGHVLDVRCSVEGTPGAAAPRYRVVGLVVSPRRTGAALGYQQEGQRGPWLVRAAIRRLHRRSVVVPWGAVASVGPGEIRLAGGTVLTR